MTGSVTVTSAQHCCQGPREPHSSQARPRGGHAAPSSPREVVQASSSPSPNSRKIPINDSPFWAGNGSAFKEQGNYHARGLSPITPDPSVALKVPPGPGPLAKADAFEKRAPHFTPRCTLSPQTCHHLPARAASRRTSGPSAFGRDAIQPLSPARCPHSPGLPDCLPGGPASVGPGPFPAPLLGALLYSHL